MLVHKVKTCECMENPEKEKVADEIPKYKDLLRLFVIAEQINWGKLCQQYQLVLRAGDNATPATGVLKKVKKAERCGFDYNILIMAKYYTRVMMQRMAALLINCNIVRRGQPSLRLVWWLDYGCSSDTDSKIFVRVSATR
ncbi:hypothetical protein OUZ56_015833 [Daphnia magna]|uniref:Uncharacterized protein n=1 Tax=Daphnia magna TaxID=35525 RepID=A0ABR0ANZ0_9CRUS|nr:hypothetical protein OUZ56_015833 [Daphnia magna]